MLTHNLAYTTCNPKCLYIEPQKKKNSQAKHTNSDKQKEEIYKWLASYKFTHFFTLRFQKHNETEILHQARQQLKKHLALFEKKLLGRHWNHKHLFFIAFAEKGKGEYWHFHILFRLDGISIEQIINALCAVEEEMKLSPHSICFDPIDHLQKTVIEYCAKEVKIDTCYKGDTSTIIPSTDLFGISPSQTYHYRNSQTAIDSIDKAEDDRLESQQAEVAVETLAQKQSVFHKLYNRAKSLLTAPLDYVGELFIQSLQYWIYTLPISPYCLSLMQVYDDLEDINDTDG